MGALFGKSKKPPSRVTEQDKAILVICVYNVHIDSAVRSESFKANNYIVTKVA